MEKELDEEDIEKYFEDCENDEEDVPSLSSNQRYNTIDMDDDENPDFDRDEDEQDVDSLDWIMDEEEEDRPEEGID